jgi:hypothetical protein
MVTLNSAGRQGCASDLRLWFLGMGEDFGYSYHISGELDRVTGDMSAHLLTSGPLLHAQLTQILALKCRPAERMF